MKAKDPVQHALTPACESVPVSRRGCRSTHAPPTEGACLLGKAFANRFTLAVPVCIITDGPPVRSRLRIWRGAPGRALHPGRDVSAPGVFGLQGFRPFFVPTIGRIGTLMSWSDGQCCDDQLRFCALCLCEPKDWCRLL